MVNTLQKNPEIDKKTISKYRTWELRLKTKEQVDTLLAYKNNKRWNYWEKRLNLIPRLSYNEFIDYIETEFEKQIFYKKDIKYYEVLLDRLYELKNFIKDKHKFKYYKEKIEDSLFERLKEQKANYFEKIITENKKYQKIFELLKDKRLITKLVGKDKYESYLILWKNNIEINFENIIEEIYKWNIEHDIIIIKIDNKNLKNIFSSENIDLNKYLTNKIRWKNSDKKIETIYNNTNYELATILALRNFIHNNKENLETIKKKIDIFRWQNIEIDEKLYRAIKFEIKSLEEKEKNKQNFEAIKNLLLENPKEGKDILIRWINTKKENILFDEFIKYLTENRWRTWAKKYKNAKILEEIIKQIENNTNSSKKTQILLKILKEKLEEINQLIKK
jgi:hypothetical protein